ncbi:MAG: Erythritol/L-threitol dehydrogenase [Anaerolineae bacterium]|nr:Erythritol/L-threitol dehydrogenase [Anaerolineae bacterium]
MRALWFDGRLQLQTDTPPPEPPPGEALIRTQLAGICNTDVEIVRGYKGFSGILGHEFVGFVERADSAPELVGRRVVGEINAYCGECATCRRGQPTQCPSRTTLGMNRRHGAMADYFTLPAKLLYSVADSLPDEWAVFVEPLAAACQILEQVTIKPTDRVVVLGDGKLGLLVAQVLQLTGCQLLVIGKHPGKLDILRRRGIATRLVAEPVTGYADVVVEVTGSAAGFAAACQLLRPRGMLVLKSTFHGDVQLDLSRLVVDEITVVGSRCGPFPAALRLLEQRLVDVEPLIHATYSLADGLAAFERAVEPGVLKVLLSMA